MRPIKFRAWNGKYMLDSAYGDWISFDGIPYTEASNKYNTPNIEVEKAKEYILMQYVGLKDKNGKEIYEGDVIRFLNGETTSTESGMECDEFLTDGAVFWDDEYAQWDITHRIDVSREDVFTDISEYEICGNIYETPNLLK